MSDLPAKHHAALAVVSRQRLLALLRTGDEPWTAASLAEAVGLHLSTTRFHLEVLEKAGLVARVAEGGGRPGRPRQVYTIVEQAGASIASPRTRYRELAEILAEALEESGETPQRAEEAGRRWADAQLPPQSAARDDLTQHGVTEQDPIPQDATQQDATQQMVTVFDRLGFAPRLVDDNHGRHLEFTACPFRELARAYPDVVCTIHLGLIRGVLNRLNVPGAGRAELHPFVDVELCVADLPRPDGAGSS